MQLLKPSIVARGQQSTESNKPPAFKTTLLYLPCRLRISRKDDKAEVSWVKQDTTSLQCVFLFIKAPAFIHPPGRAPLCYYDHFLQLFFPIETAKQRLPTHTHTLTHIYLYDQNGKKSNTHDICSVGTLGRQRSQHEGFSKKENTLRIKEECMYKTLNGMGASDRMECTYTRMKMVQQNSSWLSLSNSVQ